MTTVQNMLWPSRNRWWEYSIRYDSLKMIKVLNRMWQSKNG